MIKLEKIKVPISYRNITHYIKLGYNPILGEELEIKTEDLPSSSHVKIEVCCSICKKESILMYCKYIENKKRLGFYGCKKCSRQKAALTSIERYGIDNYSKTEEYKIRSEKTFMEKYGYKTNLLSPEHKEYTKKYLEENYNVSNFYEIRRKSTKNKFKFKSEVLELVKKDLYLSENKYDESLLTQDYILYRNECRRITEKNLKKLFKNWDGRDYYDNEYINENFQLYHNDKNYPTIDHKISIYYGFKNSINVEIIGALDNLCITKRFINSSKRNMNEVEFREDTDML
jgi:hypothetical protein